MQPTLKTRIESDGQVVLSFLEIENILFIFVEHLLRARHLEDKDEYPATIHTNSGGEL